MMALQGQSNSKTYITREIYETISVCLFRYFGFRKCGGYKLRSRISEGLINFKDFSLKFNTEQWSGIPRGLCHKKKTDVASFGTFFNPCSGWKYQGACACSDVQGATAGPMQAPGMVGVVCRALMGISSVIHIACIYPT